MKIQIDENNVITSYAIVGDVENSIEVMDDQIPDDFFGNYQRGYYKYDNDTEMIIRNEDYKPHEDVDFIDDEDNSHFVTSEDTEIKKIINLLSSVQKSNVKTMIINDKLLKQNAQLSKDILELKNEVKNGGAENGN